LQSESNLVIYVEISLGAAQDSTFLGEVKKDEILGIQRGRVVNRERERKVRLGVRRDDNIVGSAIPDRSVIDWVVDLCSYLFEVDREVIRVVDRDVNPHIDIYPVTCQLNRRSRRHWSGIAKVYARRAKPQNESKEYRNHEEYKDHEGATEKSGEASSPATLCP